MQHLEIRETKTKGRGIFAAKDFTTGEIIKTCPVIELPEPDVGHIDKTRLYDYYFGWGTKLQGAAITLGYGDVF